MADSTEPRDVELIRRLAAGDEHAFLEFYRRHQGGLYRYAIHMSGSPEAAADVVQDTFLTLIRHGGKFDEAKGTPAAFLFGIARNQLRKHQEREGRYVQLSDELGSGLSEEWSAGQPHSNGNGRSLANAVHADGILEGLERSEMVERLRDAVLTLPDHYREPLTLCDLEGKSYFEAAALLDCPVGTVRSRLNRARSILLDKLRPSRSATKMTRARSGGKA
jgi:RNA polymerase sigma-70 factor, ECF subfamily